MASTARCLALALVLAAGTAALTQSPPAIAIVGVTAIPMDRERALPDQTIVVRGDRIVAMGPSAQVAVPEGAERVDGRGTFAIPGLAEMHAHFMGGNEELTRLVLRLNLERGVTTVRNMLGHPSHLPLRARVRAGEIPGPTIYTSGPSLNGSTVPDEAAARRQVAEQKAAGYDFLKIHPGIARDPFEALAAAAKGAGIPFAGHVPAAVGIRRAIELGYRSVDHLDGYVEALLKDDAPVDRTQPGFFGLNFVDHLDESRIPDLARATKEAGVWNVPTQSLMPAFMGEAGTAALAARPEMKALPRQMVEQWVKQRTEFLAGTTASIEQRRRFFAVRGRIIKALHDAGAGLLLGADSPQVMQVPGLATHEELQALVAAGLTPYQALETGTVNVARFFGTAETTGTLAPGREASLALLEANPLDDVRNTLKITRVMARGKWHVAPGL